MLHNQGVLSCLLCDSSYETRNPIKVNSFCSQCYAPERKHELRRVTANLRRAQKEGAPATLTIKQWIHILDHFNWKCAYCSRDFQVLEHIVSVTHAGTTALNCVPACLACNRHKSTTMVSIMPQEKLDQVARQLEQLIPKDRVEPGELIISSEEDTTAA